VVEVIRKLTLLLLCPLPLSLHAQTFPDDWAGYDSFTVQAPSSALNGYLYAFPFERLSSEAIAAITNDGRCLRFADGSDNVLIHDTVWFTHGGSIVIGAAFFWSATDLTELHVWVGEPDATAHADPTQAYPASLRGFWPLATDDATGLLDRTSYNNDLTADAVTTLAGIDGPLPGTKGTPLDGSTQGFEASASLPPRSPLTQLGFLRPSNDTGRHTLMTISDTGDTDRYVGTYLDGLTANDPCAIGVNANTLAQATAFSSGVDFAANTWYQVIGINAAINSRKAGLNGGNFGATDTGTRNTEVCNVITLGKFRTSSGSSLRMTGSICLPQLWTVELSNAWIAYSYLNIADSATFYGSPTWTPNQGSLIPVLNYLNARRRR
jgi:hypothetical protein